jgi:hypothetical protein
LLLGNELHFPCRYSQAILKYDLSTREVSLIDLPNEFHYKHVVLMSTEDDGSMLGFATVLDSNLSVMCSSTVPASGGGGVVWYQSSRSVELKGLLPAAAYPSSLEVVGFADGARVIFLWTVDGIYSVDLMSGCVKKAYKETSVFGVLPCVSFCTQGNSILMPPICACFSQGKLILQPAHVIFKIFSHLCSIGREGRANVWVPRVVDKLKVFK